MSPLAAAPTSRDRSPIRRELSMLALVYFPQPVWDWYLKPIDRSRRVAVEPSASHICKNAIFLYSPFPKIMNSKIDKVKLYAAGATVTRVAEVAVTDGRKAG